MEETRNFEELDKLASTITGGFMDADGLLTTLREIKDGYMMAIIHTDDDKCGIGFPDKETIRYHLNLLDSMILVLSGKMHE
jgi:hypothetical protein